MTSFSDKQIVQTRPESTRKKLGVFANMVRTSNFSLNLIITATAAKSRVHLPNRVRKTVVCVASGISRGRSRNLGGE